MRREPRKPTSGALLDPLQAGAALTLWKAEWDTNDIAGALGVPEHAVARTVQASRDIALMMHADHIEADGGAA